MSKIEHFVEGSIHCPVFLFYFGIDMKGRRYNFPCNLPWWPYSFVTLALDGLGGQHHSPAAFTPRNRPCTQCIGGCVGPRAGLDGCRRTLPYRDSILGPSSPSRIAIPTELPGLNACSQVINENFVEILYWQNEIHNVCLLHRRHKLYQ